MDIENAIKALREELPGLEILENEPMKNHCSFKTGGPTRAYISPDGVVSFTKVCCLLKENGIAPLVVGNLTNVIFPDEGTEELIVLSTQKLQKLFLLPDGAIYAEAGVPMSKVAAFAQENGLEGFEFASGIPGTIGGGIMMNAGAYGGEMKDVIDSVVSYYLPEQRLYELNQQQLKFSYRHSVYQEIPGNAILSAVIRLKEGDREKISEKIKELNEKRRTKQPLDMPSAGSVFRRPEGTYAAAVIEEAGLKGRKVGGAQVSEKHAGFIVNTGDATTHDFYELVEQIVKEVKEKKNVDLKPEVILIPAGFKMEDNGPRIPRYFENPKTGERF